MYQGVLTRAKSVSLATFQEPRSSFRKPASALWIRQVLGLRGMCDRLYPAMAHDPCLQFTSCASGTSMGLCLREKFRIQHLSQRPWASSCKPQHCPRAPRDGRRLRKERLCGFSHFRSPPGCRSYLWTSFTKALEAGGQGPASQCAGRAHKSQCGQLLGPSGLLPPRRLT